MRRPPGTGSTRAGTLRVTHAIYYASKLCHASGSCATACHASSMVALTVACVASHQRRLPRCRWPLPNLFVGPVPPACRYRSVCRHHAPNEVHRFGHRSAIRVAWPAHLHQLVAMAWSHGGMPLCFHWIVLHAEHRRAKLGQPSPVAWGLDLHRLRSLQVSCGPLPCPAGPGCVCRCRLSAPPPLALSSFGGGHHNRRSRRHREFEEHEFARAPAPINKYASPRQVFPPQTPTSRR